MQTKQVVLSVVIVVVLALAGFFIYKAMFSSNAGDPSAEAVNNGASVNGAILPNGTSLDFDIVKKFNKSDKLFPYPTAIPTDIGQQLNGLVTSL